MTFDELIKELQVNAELFQYDTFGHPLKADIVNIAIQNNQLFVTYVLNRNTSKEHIGCCCIDCNETTDDCNFDPEMDTLSPYFKNFIKTLDHKLNSV